MYKVVTGHTFKGVYSEYEVIWTKSLTDAKRQSKRFMDCDKVFIRNNEDINFEIVIK